MSPLKFYKCLADDTRLKSLLLLVSVREACVCDLMAALELDALDVPFLMFRNAANGGLNIVYRRPDGNIGWVDPSKAERNEPA